MSDTSTPGDPGPSPGAAGTSRTRTIVDVHRSRDDRIIAGVCGGIGRRLGIDPVILRVVLAVLCLAGLAGAILYIAGWLLLPDESSGRSLIVDWFDLGTTEPQVRSAGLLGAGVLALMAIVGDTGLGFLFWPIVVTAIWIGVPVAAGYWFFVVRPRKARPDRHGSDQYGPHQPSSDQPSSNQYAPDQAHPFQSPPQEATMPAPTTAHPATAPPGTSSYTEGASATATHDAPTASWPPPPDAPIGAPPATPTPPRKRRPFSWALTLLTLSVTAIALAITYLAVSDDGRRWTLYVAIALGITAAGLLLGTVVGNAGPLIPLGLLLVAALLVGSIVPSLRAGDIRYEPTSAATVEPDYTVGMGRLTLDLTRIDDPATLEGRTITLNHGLGETMIVVPEDLEVELQVNVLAGGVDFLDRMHTGTRIDVTERSGPGPVLTLDADQSMGQVTVVRR